MSEIVLEGVSKVYPDGTEAVSSVSLDIEDGELVVLVGPSGCGKTTTLRMIAGLEEISEGEIRIGDRVVNGLQPRERDVAMVFQSYALYPHMTVYDNMAFSLRLKHTDKAEIDRRVREASSILGLEELLDKKPRNLSGGQRQRVAMGRAIVREPHAFLMDEPLSNLDAKLRVQLRAELARLLDELGTTTIYVTHDQIEAMTMGEATIEPSNGTLAAAVGSQRIVLGDEKLNAHAALRAYEGRKVILGIRPEDLEDAVLVPETAPDRRLRGSVVLREALGSEIVAHFVIDARPALTDDVRELAADVGEELTDQAPHTTMVGRFRADSAVQAGQRAEVAVETRSLHFFDPDTGAGIYDTDSAGR